MQQGTNLSPWPWRGDVFEAAEDWLAAEYWATRASDDLAQAEDAFYLARRLTPASKTERDELWRSGLMFPGQDGGVFLRRALAIDRARLADLELQVQFGLPIIEDRQESTRQEADRAAGRVIEAPARRPRDVAVKLAAIQALIGTPVEGLEGHPRIFWRLMQELVALDPPQRPRGPSRPATATDLI